MVEHRRRSVRRWVCATTLTLGAFLAVATPVSRASAQVVRQVTGTVIGADSGAPISAARILVVGTNQGALTDAGGRYVIRGLPGGSVELRVVALGFAAQVVSVGPGGDVVQDFVLEPAVFSLDEIVVTATGEQRRREVGHTIGTIDAASIVEVEAIPTTSSLIGTRVPGVFVTTGGGGTGSGSRIRIRGANSISLSNEPIVYVDGVRITSTTFQDIGVGGQTVSRLDDLNPDEIESVDVVKGPSAATLYGTDAASGVILVTTRRGVPGPTRWTAYVELGALRDPVAYPASYAAIDEDNPVPFYRNTCALVFEAQGRCTQDRVRSFAVLEDPVQSPFATGYRQQYGLAVSGGSASFQYRVSAEVESEDGVWKMPGAVVDSLTAAGIPVSPDELRPNGLDRVSIRSNFRAQLSEVTDLSITAGYVTSDLRRPDNDASQLGIFSGGLVGSSSPDIRNGWGTPLPAESMRTLTWQSLNRWTAGATLGSRPFSFLTLRATAGLDYGLVHDHWTDKIFNTQGIRQSNRSQLVQSTVDLGATADFDLTPQLTSRTSVGAQYLRDLVTRHRARGEDFPAGCASVGCAAEQSASELTDESVTLGFFADHQLGLNDRLFISGGIRADDNSAFGRDFDVAIYPKVQLSWLVSEEDFFPAWGVLDELRLRGAWGASGRAPNSLESVRYYQGITATIPKGPDFEDVSGVTVGELGNPALKPERSREFETGFDASLLSGRLGVELTYYRKRTEDALVNEPLPASLGAGLNRFVNVGRVKNDGFEASLRAALVQTTDWSVDLSVNASRNDNELLELGDHVEAIGAEFRHVEGFPLGGAWSPPLLSFDDADGNGFLTPNEIVVGDTAEFLGTPYPTRQATFGAAVTWRELVRLDALLDVRAGGIQGNGTEGIRCAFFVCRAMFDRGAPLEEQAKAMAFVFHPSATQAVYVESSDFARLREASVTVFLPDAWASRMGASQATVSLSGRNLIMWTDYSGLDPESNWNGGANFGSIDIFSQAPPRIFSVRLNVTF